MSVLPDPNATPDDDLVLLANGSMRARRRPATVAALWAWETLLGLLLAWPIAGIARAAYGDHPRGDAPLWNAGGRELFDFVANVQMAIPSASALVLAVLAIAALAGLFPLAGALVAIAFTTRDLRAPKLRDVAMRSARALTPLLIVRVLTAIAQGVTMVLGLIVGASIEGGLTSSLGEARAEQVGWIVILAFALVAIAIGVARDLSSAAVVRFRVRGVAGLRLGVNALRRAPFMTLWSWAWRAAAGLLPLAVGALLADRLGGRGGAALVALFTVHQLVIGVRVAFSTSWLAKALRSVDHAHRVVRATREEAAAAQA